MKSKSLKLIAIAMTAGSLMASAAGLQKTLTINTSKKGAEIPKTMYGLFFEDINFGADGGLYAEKIKNRSFEFDYPLQGWKAAGKVEVKNNGPFPRNPHYVELRPSGHSDKHTALVNEGFFGVSFEKDSVYDFSVYARVPDGGKSTIEVQLINEATHGGNQTYASKKIEISGKEWKRYDCSLTPSKTILKGQLRIFLKKPENTVDLEHISLFPRNNINGLRADLVKRLADLKPGVFRFPGGCR